MERTTTFKGKAVRILCAIGAAMLVSSQNEASARENAYDLLGRVLTPFVNLVAKQTKDPKRAMALVLQIEEMTGLSPELQASRIEAAVEYPDKLRLHTPVLGQPLTIVRNRQELWVHPGAKVEALLHAASAGRKLPAVNPKARLEPFRLPIPEKQIVFLPMLFQVRDAGSEKVGGDSCRILDLTLMPELARSLEATGWSARVWVRPDATPARLTISRPDWSATVRLEDVRFVAALPETTWEPTAEQAADILQISPARYEQLLKLIGGR